MILYKNKRRGNRKQLGRTDFASNPMSYGWRQHHSMRTAAGIAFASAYPGGNHLALNFCNPDETEKFTVEMTVDEAAQLQERIRLFILNAKHEKTGQPIREEAK